MLLLMMPIGMDGIEFSVKTKKTVEMKILPQLKMKLKNSAEYDILSECVSSGVAYSIMRMFKHRETETITQEELEREIETITDNVLGTITERFDFEDD